MQKKEVFPPVFCCPNMGKGGFHRLGQNTNFGQFFKAFLIEDDDEWWGWCWWFLVTLEEARTGRGWCNLRSLAAAAPSRVQDLETSRSWGRYIFSKMTTVMPTWVRSKEAHCSRRKKVGRMAREAGAPSVTKISKWTWLMRWWTILIGSWTDHQESKEFSCLRRIASPSRWTAASFFAPWIACFGTRPENTHGVNWVCIVQMYVYRKLTLVLLKRYLTESLSLELQQLSNQHWHLDGHASNTDTGTGVWFEAA